MIYFVIVLILMIVVFMIYIYRMHREIDNICHQLKIVQEGSHTLLTAQVHTKTFRALYHQLDIMLSEYQKKQIQHFKAEEQLKVTIQNMAHDLRTPLTSSMGYMSMLKESHDEIKKQRYLDTSIERMKDLAKLLEELFLYTKLMSESYTLECESLAVYPILTNTLLSFYHLFEKSGQEPVVIFQDEKSCFYMNQEAMERIFHNIIQNAFLHGLGDLKIRQDQHTLIFENTMKDDDIIDIEHIFDRFYKSDQSRNHTSSGLGLAIVKELMEKMGGQVDAKVNGQLFQMILTLRA